MTDKPAERNELVRVPDQEALSMLTELAAEDLRSMGLENAWIIRQEYNRRHSKQAASKEPARKSA